MWRKLVVVGTISATLSTGTALALPSQGGPGAAGSSDEAPSDHWSAMAVEMGDQWPTMVDRMLEFHGRPFPDMVNRTQSMDPFVPEMGGSGMWGEGAMGSSGVGLGVDSGFMNG